MVTTGMIGDIHVVLPYEASAGVGPCELVLAISSWSRGLLKSIPEGPRTQIIGF